MNSTARRSSEPPGSLPSEGGFSSVEAVLMMLVVAMSTLSMALTLSTGERTLSHIESDARILDQARTIMSRLIAVPFGTGSGSASPSQLAQLVAIENDLFGSSTTGQGAGSSGAPAQTYTGVGNLTLSQVRGSSPLQWQYQTAGGKSYFGGDGMWEVIVDRDLNGDGALTAPMEVATAGTSDLFRIEIRYDGRRILRTIRSRNPTE